MSTEPTRVPWIESARGTLFFSLIILGTSTLYHWTYFFHGPTNLFDSGVILADVERILHGQVFGRDFIAPYGPGRYYILAGFFKIFEPTLWSYDLCLLIIHAIWALVLFFVVRSLSGLGMGFIAAATAMVAHGAPHKVFLLLATTLVIRGFVRFTRSPTSARAYFLGSWMGVAGLFRYDVGAFAAVSLSLGILLISDCGIRKRFMSLLFVSIGSLTWVLPFAWALYVSGGLESWFSETLQRAIVQAETGTLPEILEESFGGVELRYISISILLSIYAVSLIMSLRNLRSSKGSLFLGVGLFGLLLMNQLFLEVKLDRFLHVLPPALILLLMMMGSMKSKTRWAVGALPVLMLLWVWTAGSSISQSSPSVRSLSRDPLTIQRGGGVILREGMAHRIESVVKTVEALASPEDEVYCYYGCPLMYFLLGRVNPLRYSEPGYYVARNDVQRKLVEQLEMIKPKVAVTKNIMISGRGRLSDQLVLSRYLSREYRVFRQFGRYSVLVRRER